MEKGCGEGRRGGDKTCREGVVWWTVSFSLSAVCLAINSVVVFVCARVEGYSGGHSPDHQISLHSDIPALPQPENTTTGSMNVCTRVCVFLI